MAQAIIFNKTGNTTNYTAQVTIVEGFPQKTIAAFKIIVVNGGAQGLTIKDLESNETIWTGKTERPMNTQDVKNFVKEITRN
ncbi:hypothetical protein [Jonesia denitrificans]|uniref:Uncharacterized protein n=1 Tax=Jonesia denitrificans (strain ATCC 14870 / DSM 20603 / BCRC 15368 / CIP 55.134 / JCM 11481 / NBRC 15587 / NCTC 10816 / Prevot 55134) TaxID=471856 RepID=C7R280_JONDD|nr:hypothetical protein [Jonesia denitrificans]ACV09968.1 hypothetical protein Jden_2333 [Jonesia denitrificans DSM 20603]ASE08794.1 hypothetical protein CEP80_06350 [Jonesia denitrificans]ASE08851.1 hypothetical protein CEP80_06650 [Jonesia denitrificans]QXB43399.1 hypothetical protein I6L70_00315 [Jonesia denitrificans]SQH22743.1 Uncharacterised protein [Jonesia denitrificans]